MTESKIDKKIAKVRKKLAKTSAKLDKLVVKKAKVRARAAAKETDAGMPVMDIADDNQSAA